MRFGTARWAVGYPKIALGATLYPFNVHRAAAMGGYASMHAAGGGNFIFADGSVHFLAQSIELSVYNAAATRAGNEVNNAGLHE